VGRLFSELAGLLFLGQLRKKRRQAFPAEGIMLVLAAEIEIKL
jgi:glucose uptake protein GlcU